jgi:hypothetical protein
MQRSGRTDQDGRPTTVERPKGRGKEKKIVYYKYNMKKRRRNN